HLPALALDAGLRQARLLLAFDLPGGRAGFALRTADDTRAVQPSRQGHRPGHRLDQHDAPARRLLRRGLDRDLHPEAVLVTPAEPPGACLDLRRPCSRTI